MITGKRNDISLKLLTHDSAGEQMTKKQSINCLFDIALDYLKRLSNYLNLHHIIVLILVKQLPSDNSAQMIIKQETQPTMNWMHGSIDNLFVVCVHSSFLNCIFQFSIR